MAWPSEADRAYWWDFAEKKAAELADLSFPPGEMERERAEFIRQRTRDEYRARLSDAIRCPCCGSLR